eukprot:3311344-Pleurochrysis_carterae.AAC.1
MPRVPSPFHPRRSSPPLLSRSRVCGRAHRVSPSVAQSCGNLRSESRCSCPFARRRSFRSRRGRASGVETRAHSCHGSIAGAAVQLESESGSPSSEAAESGASCKWRAAAADASNSTSCGAHRSGGAEVEAEAVEAFEAEETVEAEEEVSAFEAADGALCGVADPLSSLAMSSAAAPTTASSTCSRSLYGSVFGFLRSIGSESRRLG